MDINNVMMMEYRQIDLLWVQGYGIIFKCGITKKDIFILKIVMSSYKFIK